MTKFSVAVVFILLCALGRPTIGYSQKPSNRIVNAVKDFSKKNKKEESLTMQLLKSATQFKYGVNNWSVAPEFHYQGYIIVTPTSVMLNIYNMSSLCFTETEYLTTSQYASFLNRLYGLRIKTNPDEPLMLCGGGVYTILIQKNSSILFKGIEDEDIVTTKGRLCDAFLPLLNLHMRDVYNDPSSTFGTIIDIFPEDQNF